MEVEVEENNNKEKIGEIYRQKMFTSFVQWSIILRAIISEAEHIWACRR
jgi:hypothetical protein